MLTALGNYIRVRAVGVTGRVSGIGPAVAPKVLIPLKVFFKALRVLVRVPSRFEQGLIWDEGSVVGLGLGVYLVHALA